MDYVVITACLNSLDTIEKSIVSVLSQEILPSQYIFVDGGSIDGTIELLNNWKSKIEAKNIEFRLIHQTTKGGIYEAWNLALAQVNKQSDLIFILNSDDWYDPKCATIVFNAFNKDKDMDVFCASSLNYYNYKGNVTAKKSYNKSLVLFPLLMPLVHPACFIKKKVYDEIGFFNQNYKVSGDYDFLYRCYTNKCKIHTSKIKVVNRLMGGWADTHRNIARKETLVIGMQYSKFKRLPKFAFLLRKFFNR